MGVAHIAKKPKKHNGNTGLEATPSEAQGKISISSGPAPAPHNGMGMGMGVGLHDTSKPHKTHGKVPEKTDMGMGMGGGHAKIQSLTFMLVGGSMALSNAQEGKSGVTGSAISGSSAHVSCNTNQFIAVSIGGTINIPVSGTEMHCVVVGSNAGRQEIAIHTR